MKKEYRNKLISTAIFLVALIVIVAVAGYFGY